MILKFLSAQLNFRQVYFQTWPSVPFPRAKEKSQINNLTLHLKQLEKEEMKTPRVSRRKEILKIRAEINAKQTKET